MENIQVCIRVRPHNPSEIEANDPETWEISESATIRLIPGKHLELVKSKKLGLTHRTDFTYSKH